MLGEETWEGRSHVGRWGMQWWRYADKYSILRFCRRSALFLATSRRERTPHHHRDQGRRKHRKCAGLGTCVRRLGEETWGGSFERSHVGRGGLQWWRYADKNAKNASLRFCASVADWRYSWPHRGGKGHPTTKGTRAARNIGNGAGTGA
jgi:hypothetical protein